MKPGNGVGREPAPDVATYTYAGMGYSDPDAPTKIADGHSITTCAYDVKGPLTSILGGTNVTSDSSMNLAQWLDYAPYGSVLASENTGTTTSARQYIGQFSDASGLSHLNARYYNSNQGQFISEDPTFLSIGNQTQLQQLSQQDQKILLQNPQQLNSYSYSQDNPIVDKDPNGLLALQIKGEYTVPLWGLSGEGGIYIDQNGIDYYYGAGLGAIGGADATIGVTTAVLSHTYSVSAAGFAAGGDVVGPELEKGEIYYPYSLRKPQSYQEASVGLSEELTGGVMSQVSGPLIVWNQPQSSANYSLPYPQMTSNLSNKLSVSNGAASPAVWGGSSSGLPSSVSQNGVTYVRNSSGLLNIAK
jgi:RHS repeat-associated protein